MPLLPPAPRQDAACAHFLRQSNRIIRQKHRTVYIGFGNRKYLLAYALRRERIRSETACFCVHRSSSRQRLRQRRRGEGLDADHLDCAPYQAAIPAIRPPPPTDTSSVSISGTWSLSSS